MSVEIKIDEREATIEELLRDGYSYNHAVILVEKIMANRNNDEDIPF